MLKKTSKLFGLLQNEKQEIEALVFYMSNEKFNRKIIPEEWSVAQVIQHIYMAETQTLQSILWRLENKSLNQSVPFSSYLKVFYAIALFKLKIKTKAPSFVTPTAELIDKEKLFEEWEKTRQDWNDFLYKHSKKYGRKVAYKHPLLGYLSLYLTLTFMYHHLYHHKLQVAELVEIFSI